jgi:hypothetical protein
MVRGWSRRPRDVVPAVLVRSPWQPHRIGCSTGRYANGPERFTRRALNRKHRAKGTNQWRGSADHWIHSAGCRSKDIARQPTTLDHERVEPRLRLPGQRTRHDVIQCRSLKGNSWIAQGSPRSGYPGWGASNRCLNPEWVRFTSGAEIDLCVGFRHGFGASNSARGSSRRHASSHLLPR